VNHNKHYTLAVASSLVSKLGTTLLQLTLLPLAASSLGNDGFALYMMLTAASGWVALTSLGLGPILSVKIAFNEIDGTPKNEQTLVASAFWTSLALTALASGAAVVTAIGVPPEKIFGSHFETRSRELIVGFLFLSAGYVLQSNFAIFEAAQNGLQRQHTTNLVVAAGAFATIPAAVAVAHWKPTPIALLSAGILPTLVFRFWHVVWILRRRITLLPKWRSFDLGTAKALLSAGTVYSLAGSAGNFISHALPTIQVGRILNSAQTGAFASTLYLITLLSGITAMFVSPAVPAFATNVALRNHLWLRSTYTKLLIASIVMASIAAIALVFLGPIVFGVWLRGTIMPDFALRAWAGLYFILSTWEVLHFSLLVAMHKTALASLLVLARSIAGAIFTHPLLATEQAAAPFIAMCVAILVVNFAPLYLLARSGLNPKTS
jgi:O-antigen/teichoic acid export membrane protein